MVLLIYGGRMLVYREGVLWQAFTTKALRIVMSEKERIAA